MVRVVVGVHARRGDKLRVWRQQGYIRDILGRYEGRFFRHAMEVLRRRHGDVVFIVTSDNVSWARAQLASAAHNDTFFSADFTRAPAAGPTQGTDYLH